MEFSHHNKAFTLNVPEWFARKDFLSAIDNNNIMTWRENKGEAAGEYDDVVVFVDPSLGEFNEGSEQGVLPEDIWLAVVAKCRLHVGTSGQAANMGSITVRLTNLVCEDPCYPETSDTLTWSTKCGAITLTLPRDEALAIAAGTTSSDALLAREGFQAQFPEGISLSVVSRTLGTPLPTGIELKKALLEKACADLKTLLEQ